MQHKPPQIEPSLNTVLVVESRKALRNIAVRALKQHGFTVLEAHDLKQAVLILKNSFNLSVIIFDIPPIPRYNISALNKFLQMKELQDIKIILWSAVNVEIYENRLPLEKIDAVIMKPTSPKIIAETVKKALYADASANTHKY